MKEIIVAKEKLIEALTANQQKHQNIYDAAVSGYFIQAEKVLGEKLTKIQNQEKIESYLNLEYPQNFDGEYVKALKMLEFSIEDKITLTSTEFDCYIMNRWGWRSEFLQMSTHYITGAYLASGCSDLKNF